MLKEIVSQASFRLRSTTGLAVIAKRREWVKERAERMSDSTDMELDKELDQLVALIKSEAKHEITDAKCTLLAVLAQLAFRTLEDRPMAYLCQLETALHLIRGDIVEQANGEGKTLSCALCAAFFALLGEQVHVATYNHYLAERDARWMGCFYARLGLECAAYRLSEGFFYSMPCGLLPEGREIDLLEQWHSLISAVQVEGDQAKATQSRAVHWFLLCLQNASEIAPLFDYVSLDLINASLADALAGNAQEPSESSSSDLFDLFNPEPEEPEEQRSDLRCLARWMTRHAPGWTSTNEIAALPDILSTPLDAVRRFALEQANHAWREPVPEFDSEMPQARLQSLDDFTWSFDFNREETQIEAAEEDAVFVPPPLVEDPAPEVLVERRNIELEAFRNSLSAAVSENWIASIHKARNGEVAADYAITLRSDAISALLDRGTAQRAPILDCIHRGSHGQLTVVHALNGERDHYLASASIVYGIMNDFAFAELRADSAQHWHQIAFPLLEVLLVDECDDSLIDKATQPYSIVEEAEDQIEQHLKVGWNAFMDAVSVLKAGLHFHPDSVRITDQGQAALAASLGVPTLLCAEFSGVIACAENVLLGLYHWHVGENWVWHEGAVTRWDKSSGRPLLNSPFPPGLREAIEWQQGVLGRSSSLRLSRAQRETTMQSFVRRYRHLAGLSGSASWYVREFAQLYRKELVLVAPRVPCLREHLDDRIYSTLSAKFVNVVWEIIAQAKIKRPILVDCANPRQAEFLAAVLRSENHEQFQTHLQNFIDYASEERLGRAASLTEQPKLDPANIDTQYWFTRLQSLQCSPKLLTSGNLEEEPMIIAGAGMVGALTITAKLAGRGTDIRVDEEANELGGLYVIGFERNESRHIDQQVQGRTARQGRKGSCIFFCSFQDPMMQQFSASDRLTTLMKRMGLGPWQELQHPWLNKSVQSAQSRLAAREGMRLMGSIRREESADQHRRFVLGFRREVLRCQNASSMAGIAHRMISNVLVRNASEYLRGKTGEWNLNDFTRALEKIGILSRSEIGSRIDGRLDQFLPILNELYERAVSSQRKRLGDARFVAHARESILGAIDSSWVPFIAQCNEIDDQAYRASGWLAPAEGSLVHSQNERTRLYWETVRQIEIESLKRLLTEAPAESDGPPPANSPPEVATNTPEWTTFRSLRVEVLGLRLVSEFLNSLLRTKELKVAVFAITAYLIGVCWQVDWWSATTLTSWNTHAIWSGPMTLLMGPALLCGGSLLLGAIPIILRAGLRLGVPSFLELHSSGLRLFVAGLVGCLLWFAMGGSELSLSWSNWLQMILPTLVCCWLAVRVDNYPQGVLFSFFRMACLPLLPAAIAGGLVWVGRLWFPWMASTPLMMWGMVSVIYLGWRASFQIHNALQAHTRLTFWQLHLVTTFSFALCASAVRQPLDLIPTSLIAVSLGMCFVRLGKSEVTVVVDDFSHFEPKERTFTLPIPNLIILLVGLISTYLLGVLGVFVGKGVFGIDVSVAGVMHPLDLLWPIASLFAISSVIYLRAFAQTVARLYAQILAKDFRRSHQMVRVDEEQGPMAEQLARRLIAVMGRRFGFMVLSLLFPWLVMYGWRLWTGRSATLPLGLAGFPILLFLTVDVMLLWRNRLARGLQRLNVRDQWLTEDRLQGLDSSVSRYASPLLNPESDLIRNLKEVLRHDPLRFLKEMYTRARVLDESMHRIVEEDPKQSAGKIIFEWVALIATQLILGGAIALGIGWLLHKLAGDSDSLGSMSLPSNMTLFWGSFLVLLLWVVIKEIRERMGKSNTQDSSTKDALVDLGILIPASAGSSEADLANAEIRSQANLESRRAGICESIRKTTEYCNAVLRNRNLGNLFNIQTSTVFDGIVNAVTDRNTFLVAANDIYVLFGDPTNLGAPFKEAAKQVSQIQQKRSEQSPHSGPMQPYALMTELAGAATNMTPDCAAIAMHLRSKQFSNLLRVRHYFGHANTSDTNRVVGELFTQWIGKSFPNDPQDWSRAHLGLLTDLNRWLIELKSYVDEPERLLTRGAPQAGHGLE